MASNMLDMVDANDRGRWVTLLDTVQSNLYNIRHHVVFHTRIKDPDVDVIFGRKYMCGVVSAALSHLHAARSVPSPVSETLMSQHTNLHGRTSIRYTSNFLRFSLDILHQPPPNNIAQHAWRFRSRCPCGQVHQLLRRFLEASGKAPNSWFVKSYTAQTCIPPPAARDGSHGQQGIYTFQGERNLNPVRDGGLHVGIALQLLTESTGWSDTVKTSQAKELPPQSIDWYGPLHHPSLLYTYTTQVLRPSRWCRPSHLPAQDRWCWPSAQGARWYQEPRHASISPRRCFRLGRP